MPPGVEHRPSQRAHPLEEDLRDEEIGEDHHQAALRPGNARYKYKATRQARGDSAARPTVRANSETVARVKQPTGPMPRRRRCPAWPRSRATGPRCWWSPHRASGHKRCFRQGVGVVVGNRHRSDAGGVGQDEGAQESRCHARARVPSAMTLLDPDNTPTIHFLSCPGPGGGPPAARNSLRVPGRVFPARQARRGPVPSRGGPGARPRLGRLQRRSAQPGASGMSHQAPSLHRGCPACPGSTVSARARPKRGQTPRLRPLPAHRCPGRPPRRHAGMPARPREGRTRPARYR